MKKIKSNHGLIRVLGMAVCIAIITPGLIWSAEVIDKQVASALLKENWAEVVTLLDSVTPDTPSPVLRLIKGHACLSMNRNNESLCLFLSTSKADNLKTWEGWTQIFINEHPKEVAALYLRGDALARSAKYDEAIRSFSAGAQSDRTNPLVVNARGVAYAHQNQLAKARQDFENAITLSNDSLADAYANLGAYWIQRKEGAEGAIKAFNNALLHSPDFALALHGRGCVKLVLKKEEAKKDLEEALKTGECAKELMLLNILRYAAQVSKIDAERIVADARESGTTFKRQYGELGDSAKNWFEMSRNFDSMKQIPFNQHISKYCGNRGVERLEQMESQYGMNAVGNWGKNNSDLFPTATKNIERVGGYNRSAKPYETAIKDLGAAASLYGTFTKDVRVAAGGKAVELSADKAREWSMTHAEFSKNYMDKLGSAGGSFKSNSLNQGAGGVDIKFTNIDDGEWPFKEFYCLVYEFNQQK